MEVIGLPFTGPKQRGDFEWMIAQGDHAPDGEDHTDALFIFNDNEEQFLAFLASQKDPTKTDEHDYGCRYGAGNASIRPYRCTDPPRAAGVPTGWIATNEGYPSLTPDVTRVLDMAFAEVRRVLASGLDKRVFYSAENAQGDLGHGIFDPGTDVKGYIVAEFRKL